jgi:hypothetical protein
MQEIETIREALLKGDITDGLAALNQLEEKLNAPVDDVSTRLNTILEYIQKMRGDIANIEARLGIGFE